MSSTELARTPRRSQPRVVVRHREQYLWWCWQSWPSDSTSSSSHSGKLPATVPRPRTTGGVTWQGGGSLASAAANGCYEANRAVSLSGVPKTTVYSWANHGVVVPSVSPVREKLWSYFDLMALRIVSWLCHVKEPGEGQPLPASPMPKVRRALVLLDELGLDLWDDKAPFRSPPLGDAAGEIFLRIGDAVRPTRHGVAAPSRTDASPGWVTEGLSAVSKPNLMGV